MVNCMFTINSIILLNDYKFMLIPGITIIIYLLHFVKVAIIEDIIAIKYQGSIYNININNAIEMGLIDLFKKKKLIQENNSETKSELPVIKEEDFIDNTDPSVNGNSIYSVEFGSKLPIDVIYGFLKENYENKAYNDALTNPDKSYKETNIAIIRSNLEVKFKQVMLKYEDMLREINFHIQSRGQAGLTDIVELLKSKKDTYEKHIEELKHMKQDLDKEELYMIGIFKSYEVGFTRGLASLSLHNLRIDNTL